MEAMETKGHVTLQWSDSTLIERFNVQHIKDLVAVDDRRTDVRLVTGITVRVMGTPESIQEKIEQSKTE